MVFDVIQDTRFDKTPAVTVNEWVQDILAKLDKLPVLYKVDNMRKLHFLGDGDEKANDSYRQKVYVNKTNKVSWETIYKTINSIKACVYKFV